jgi:hypothetical protein
MTRRRGKLPVDRLPGAAWARIREEVFAELDSEAPSEPPAPRRGVGVRGAVLGAAALLVASTALVVALAGKDPPPPGSAISRIVTAADVTRATVGEATLEVAPESELSSSGNDVEGWTVVMERGRVSFALPRREGRPPFRVRAGSVAIEVVGTRFTVERVRGRVDVSVDRGLVRLIWGDQARLLGQGDRWTSAPAEPSARSGAVPGAPDASDVSPQAPIEPAPTVPREASRRERYEAASGLEGSDPSRAIASYLELGKGSDGWAANALYAAGRLELERGRAAQARNLLERYLARFPGGQNAQEARALLERTH